MKKVRRAIIMLLSNHNASHEGKIQQQKFDKQCQVLFPNQWLAFDIV
jgi:hypothetical protein